jgi:peptide chain release factor 1
MADPATASNPAEYQKVAKAAAELEEQVSAYSKYRGTLAALQEAKEMLRESDGGGIPWTFVTCSLAATVLLSVRSVGVVSFLLAVRRGAGDPEMAELAREEVASLSGEIERIAQLLKVLLLPKDPMDERNIMLEASRPPFFVVSCPHVTQRSERYARALHSCIPM